MEVEDFDCVCSHDAFKFVLSECLLSGNDIRFYTIPFNFPRISRQWREKRIIGSTSAVSRSDPPKHNPVSADQFPRQFESRGMISDAVIIQFLQIP